MNKEQLEKEANMEGHLDGSQDKSPRWRNCPLVFGLGTLALSSALGLFSAGAGTTQLGTATNGVGQFMVVRTDGIEQRLEGQGSLPLYEGDVIKTEGTSQGLLELTDGIQVAVNENSTILLLSRWEQEKGITPILRLTSGELWVKIAGGPKPLEVETPVATAAVKSTEFDIKVHQDGETTLNVMEGVVEFGTAFGTCPIRTNTISYGKRGKKCTKPAPADVQASKTWTTKVLPAP
jgi:hypothetical protein